MVDDDDDPINGEERKPSIDGDQENIEDILYEVVMEIL